MRYSDEMIKELDRIRPRSSVLRILPPHFLPYADFIRAQMQKWIKASGVEISLLSVADRSFQKLLKGSNYDRIIVDAALLERNPSPIAEEMPHSDGATSARSKILGSRKNPRRCNFLSAALIKLHNM